MVRAHRRLNWDGRSQKQHARSFFQRSIVTTAPSCRPAHNRRPHLPHHHLVVPRHAAPIRRLTAMLLPPHHPHGSLLPHRLSMQQHRSLRHENQQSRPAPRLNLRLLSRTHHLLPRLLSPPAPRCHDQPLPQPHRLVLFSLFPTSTHTE